MAGRVLSLTILAIVAATVLAGCQPTTTMVSAAGGPVLTVPEDTISVFQLAERLGLEARCKTRLSITLTNAANTVIVYSNPGGRVFVNGRQVGPTGGVTCIDDVLFVSAAYEEDVRSVLRPVMAEVKPPPCEVLPGKGDEVCRLGCRVVIDAGHGGNDPGAIGVNGLHEKVVNLAVALEAARLLKAQGHDVRLTRQDDTFVELGDRAALANRVEPALFVSIHSDSHSKATARGYTVYVARQASVQSLRAAQAIERAMAATGLRSQGVRRADYRVLVGSACPAVLVEMGYLSNAAEAKLLGNASFQKKMAQAIAAGISSAVGGGS